MGLGPLTPRDPTRPARSVGEALRESPTRSGPGHQGAEATHPAGPGRSTPPDALRPPVCSGCPGCPSQGHSPTDAPATGHRPAPATSDLLALTAARWALIHPTAAAVMAPARPAAAPAPAPGPAPAGRGAADGPAGPGPGPSALSTPVPSQETTRDESR